MKSFNMTHQELFEEVLDSFAPILYKREVLKGEILQESGKRCPNLFLVKQGILRAFYYQGHKDITAHFAFSYESITAPQSFILGIKSKYFIQALEDGLVYVVKNTDLESFLDKHPSLESLVRKFTQLQYLELLERIEGINFLTAQERYLTLLDRNPELPLRVNLGYIASYLGVTQETLSRIRAKKES